MPAAETVTPLQKWIIESLKLIADGRLPRKASAVASVVGLALLCAPGYAQNSAVVGDRAAEDAHGQAVPGVSAVLTRQVFAAESSFAATMAHRDSAAFATFIAPDAIFFGDSSVLRGKRAIVDAWRGQFAEPAAPFSWKPEQVEVLASGTLAHTSGPVYDAKGQKIGNFNSIWRRERNGSWLVVFDKVYPVCGCDRRT